MPNPIRSVVLAACAALICVVIAPAARADCIGLPPTTAELFAGSKVVVVGRVHFLERREERQADSGVNVEGTFEILGPAYFKGLRVVHKAGGLRVHYFAGHMAPGCDFVDDMQDGGLYRLYLDGPTEPGGAFYIAAAIPLPEPGPKR